MEKKKTIKVAIIGSVHDGTKFLEGVNELPLDQAISLVESGHAELVPDLPVIPNDPPAGDPPAGENTNPDGDQDNKNSDSDNSKPESKTETDNKESGPSQENKIPDTKANEPEKEKIDSKNAENLKPWKKK